MANYSLPHFGELDPKNLEEYYNVDIEYGGREIQIDLNFETNSIDSKRLDLVKKFIENISEFDKRNKKYIEQDYADDDSDTVKTYVEHHLEEIGSDGLSEIIDFGNTETDPEMQLSRALQLVRVGLYPDGDEQFATFDYSIGQELTDYLVVINTDEKGNLEDMTMES